MTIKSENQSGGSRTTITKMDGPPITDCPDTLAAASATIKKVAADHNATCRVKILARIKHGTAMVEVAVARKSGRAKKWIACHHLTMVQAFANGVVDTVKKYHDKGKPAPKDAFGAWLAGSPNPEREFVSHADESAYFFGTVEAAQAV